MDNKNINKDKDKDKYIVLYKYDEWNMSDLNGVEMYDNIQDVEDELSYLKRNVEGYDYYNYRDIKVFQVKDVSYDFLKE